MIEKFRINADSLFVFKLECTKSYIQISNIPLDLKALVYLRFMLRSKFALLILFSFISPIVLASSDSTSLFREIEALKKIKINVFDEIKG